MADIWTQARRLIFGNINIDINQHEWTENGDDKGPSIYYVTQRGGGGVSGNVTTFV